MTRGTGVIAMIGSTAPFVGLFGTVWGIMDSFVGISQAHTSNLAVVAPGIAEALLATAIGLVAAIPAVVIYNGFARATAGYRALLSDAVRRGDAPPVARPRSRRRTGPLLRIARRSRPDGGQARLERRRRPRRDGRHQRHALHRRGAAAAHHLHGGGAAVDRRRAGRPPGVERHHPNRDRKIPSS